MTRTLVALIVVGCGAAPKPAPAPPATAVAQASTTDAARIPAGYVEVKATQVVDLPEGGAVLLVDEADQLAVPIFIGGTEANSIELRLRGEHFVRPLTHDLLDEMLHRLHAQIAKVQVDDLRDNTFIGSVTLVADGKVQHFDARPSDAIALAIGNHVPIYVKRTVLDRAGVKLDQLQQMLAPMTGSGPVG